MNSGYVWTDMGSQPLVSCIMPTYGRPSLVPESVAMFLEQDYPNKELVILNDCPGQKYFINEPTIRVINVPSRFPSLGEKRNESIRIARGSVIAVWDDDDVYLPWRLSYSVQQMLESKAPFFLANEFWAYWGEDRLQDNQAVPGWISHPLAIFRRDLWELAGGYPRQTLGEDAVFFQRVFDVLGVERLSHNIMRHDRFLILRGKSEYHHTSITGGTRAADTSPGEIHIAPHAILDPVLRRAADRLVKLREIEPNRPKRTSSGERWAIADSANSHVCMFLDDVIPARVRVGYGHLGLHGDLGYDNKQVKVHGRRPGHALSAHGNSELSFDLDGRFESFCSLVALNDDIAFGQSAADFLVFADDKLAGVATNVHPGDPPRVIEADIRDAKELRLIVRAHRWEYCHSVWCEPCVKSSAGALKNVLTDCLERARIFIPADAPETDVCIATVGSDGFEGWIDDLFGSICANGQCPEALLAVFSFGDSAAVRRVARKYNALVIPCQALAPLNAASKSVLYSAGRVIRANKFICLDADMLVLGDLRPVLSGIESHSPGSILVCREQSWLWVADLDAAVRSIYSGEPADIERLLNSRLRGESKYPLVINDGLFAGSRAALCSADSAMRNMKNPAQWMDSGVAWRNQFVFNLALGHLRCGIELDEVFNVQLNCRDIEFEERCGVPVAKHNGRSAVVVHFNGQGRGKHPELRGRYRTVCSPLARPCSTGNGYDLFVAALRQWVGQRGIERLAWSFYGTQDASSAHVSDASSFPLLATLHSLIRSNGCERILETGTARGVSTACLASAVAHRKAGAVVSFDPAVFPERDELWGLLPTHMRKCIQTRQVDSIEGMRAALRAGETFQAALLDSIHTCEHVLQEFELASQLICEGGLILIHDPLLSTGTVCQAVEEIVQRGYRGIRLWSATDGIPEDAGLGLAVIENRRYS